MPQFRMLQSDEINRMFAPISRRALRAEEMRPYQEAAQQLGPDKPGGIIELDIDENPRVVMTRMHRAAHEVGKYLRFQRHGKDQRELRFRLQTPEETQRLKERGAKLAQSRKAKR